MAKIKSIHKNGNFDKKNIHTPIRRIEEVQCSLSLQVVLKSESLKTTKSFTCLWMNFRKSLHSSTYSVRKFDDFFSNY